VEGGAAAAALARVFYRFARGVVVVAELFAAQAWALAAASVGEDVAALVLFGGWCGVLHGLVPHPVKCVQSLLKKRPASGLPGAGRWLLRLNAKARLFGRAFFFYYFYCIELKVTKLQVWMSLFFGLQVIHSGLVNGF
jgi:hypothetical protein